MTYLFKQNLKADSVDPYYIGYVKRSGELVIPINIAVDQSQMLDPKDFSQGIIAVLEDGKELEHKEYVSFSDLLQQSFIDTRTNEYKVVII